jgi:hypothetical protein
MLIVALVLAVIGLAALVTAVVTSNELIAWVCIAASVIGVLLLIVDAVRERSRRDAGEAPPAEADETEAQPEFDEEYPEEPPVAAEPEGESDVETTAVTTEQRDDEVADEDRNSR